MFSDFSSSRKVLEKSNKFPCQSRLLQSASPSLEECRKAFALLRSIMAGISQYFMG